MYLLVAYQDDPAGSNMAKFISKPMEFDGKFYHKNSFDLLITPTPTISADWLGKYDYNGFIFLSKHFAESGVLALTCHNTGNFSEAKFGGRNREVAIPDPYFQKKYLQNLWVCREKFSDFQITIEATHHGPTALSKPTIFVEIGTTEKQWNDIDLCNSVAKIVVESVEGKIKPAPVAIGFGGTHYSEKFTKEIIEGKYAMGTVVPKYSLEFLDEDLFSHIIERNKEAKTVILDWEGLGPQKQKIVKMLEKTTLEVKKI